MEKDLKSFFNISIVYISIKIFIDLNGMSLSLEKCHDSFENKIFSKGKNIRKSLEFNTDPCSLFPFNCWPSLSNNSYKLRNFIWASGRNQGEAEPYHGQDPSYTTILNYSEAPMEFLHFVFWVFLLSYFVYLNI
jgi:hypothetical protein